MNKEHFQENPDPRPSSDQAAPYSELNQMIFDPRFFQPLTVTLEQAYTREGPVNPSRREQIVTGRDVSDLDPQNPPITHHEARRRFLDNMGA